MQSGQSTNQRVPGEEPAGSFLHLAERLHRSAASHLERAASFLAAGQPGGAADALRCAADIVGELHAALDFEVGAELARDLDRVYAQCRKRIMNARDDGDPEAAHEVSRWLLSLGDAMSDARRGLGRKR